MALIDAHLLQLYDMVLLVKQELLDGQAALMAEMKRNDINAEQLVRLASKLDRLTLLLKDLVRELLTAEPELLARFDARLFDHKLDDVLCRTNISRPIV